MTKIEGLDMALPCKPHGPSDVAGPACAEQQVHVVVHEDEGMDLDPVLAAGATQQLLVMLPVLVVQKDGAAVYAALGDMHRNARKLQAWLTWHECEAGGWLPKVPPGYHVYTRRLQGARVGRALLTSVPFWLANDLGRRTR